MNNISDNNKQTSKMSKNIADIKIKQQEDIRKIIDDCYSTE